MANTFLNTSDLGDLTVTPAKLSGSIPASKLVMTDLSIATSQLTGILQATQFPALSGDVSTVAGALTTTLATVNTNVGSWGLAASVPQFTVNAKGLITAATNVSIQIAESQVTNLVADLASKVNKAGDTMSGFLYLSGTDSTNALSAATKGYVDALAQGINQKPTARATTNGTLPANTYNNGTSGVGATLTATANGALAAQDGVTLVLNDILLVRNEATAANNGLYVLTQVGDATHPYILTRHIAMDDSVEFNGSFIPVAQEGTTYKNSLWLMNYISPFTVGTSSVTFTELNRAADLVQGTGIIISGNTVSTNDTYIKALLSATTSTGITYTPSTGVFALSAIPNSSLTNSTISGVALGGTLPALTIGTGLSGTSYNGSAVITIANTGVLSFSGGTTGLTPNTATTGAITLAGTLNIANGGTGQTTAAAAFNALSPMTTAGDIIYGGTSGAGTRLAAGTATQVLHGGTVPSWSAVSLTADVTGLLPNANLANSQVTINGTAVSLGGSITISASTTAALTMNNSGTGAASGTVFNGGTAQTISYNTIGAPSTTGTNASGTWGISVTGNAATVTNGVYTTSTFNLGTTSIALNRASAAQSLTGISIDGTAASETLATVTGRGATTTSAITVNGMVTSYNGTSGLVYLQRSATTNNAIVRFDNGGVEKWRIGLNAASGDNSLTITDGNGNVKYTMDASFNNTWTGSVTSTAVTSNGVLAVKSNSTIQLWDAGNTGFMTLSYDGTNFITNHAVSAPNFIGPATGLTGTAASLTAGNATLWASNPYSGTLLTTAPSGILGWDGTNWRQTSLAGMQSWLGITGGPFLPIASSSTPLTGNLTLGAVNASTQLIWNYNSNASSRQWRGLTDVTSFGDWALQQSTTQTGTTFQNVLYIDPSRNVTLYGNVNTSGSVTGGAASFTTGAFSGLINSTVGNNNAILQSTSASTGYSYINILNTSGWLRLGVENSTGGALATGTLAYSSSIGSATSTAFHLYTNNIVRQTIDASGNVGIGTTSPYSISANYGTLTMEGSSGAGVVFRIGGILNSLIYYDASGLVISQNTSNQIRLFTNATLALTLASNQAATFASSVTATAGTFSSTLTATTPQPTSLATSGTAATQVLAITGGKGGNTTGTTGQVGGAGALVNITAGAGGDAPGGSTNGTGGSVIINSGAAGAGAGSVGSAGNITLTAGSAALNIQANGVNAFTGAVSVSTNELVVGSLSVGYGSSSYLYNFDVAGTSRFGGLATFNAGATIVSSALSTTGAITTAAWGTTGINLKVGAATYTDNSTAASTTVANNMPNVFGQPTLAASNTAVTYTTAANIYIAGAPAAGTNVTITTPYALLAVGNIGASGFFNTSDLTLKNVITRTHGVGFDNIVYTWKDMRDDYPHYGYGAQDVQKVLPGAVKMGADDKLGVNYGEANAYKIMMLEKKILDLEFQIGHIKNKQS